MSTIPDPWGGGDRPARGLDSAISPYGEPPNYPDGPDGPTDEELYDEFLMTLPEAHTETGLEKPHS